MTSSTSTGCPKAPSLERSRSGRIGSAAASRSRDISKLPPRSSSLTGSSSRRSHWRSPGFPQTSKRRRHWRSPLASCPFATPVASFASSRQAMPRIVASCARSLASLSRSSPRGAPLRRRRLRSHELSPLSSERSTRSPPSTHAAHGRCFARFSAVYRRLSPGSPRSRTPPNARPRKHEWRQGPSPNPNPN